MACCFLQITKITDSSNPINRSFLNKKVVRYFFLDKKLNLSNCQIIF